MANVAANMNGQCHIVIPIYPLALGAALYLQQNRPAIFNLISQLILLSPWLDLSLEAVRHGPYQTQQTLDKAAGADVLEVLRDAYLDNERADNPMFSPLHQGHSQLAALPQVMIIAGECEALIADAVLSAHQLRDAQAPVMLLIKHGLTHNYMVFKDLGGEAVAEMTAAVIQDPK